MKSKASAPGKIILFGEHFVVYDVKAILCAIDKRVTVTSEDFDSEIISIDSNIGSLMLEKGKEISEINSPLKPFYFLANKMLENQNEIKGIKIKVESDIPQGVGLGSSSACCVAAAASISRLFTKKTKEEILQDAINAERTIFQNTSGADCTVCTYGGLMQYDRKNGFSKIEYKPNFQLVIGNSNVEHSTEKVVSQVSKFKENNEKEFLELCQKESEIVEEALNLMESTDLEKLGKKINQNQEFLEKIGISNNKLRKMIETGQKSSYGAKITGAGGGGCMFALADENNHSKILTDFKNMNYECFSAKIDFKGLDTF